MQNEPQRGPGKSLRSHKVTEPGLGLIFKLCPLYQLNQYEVISARHSSHVPERFGVEFLRLIAKFRKYFFFRPSCGSSLPEALSEQLEGELF